MSVYVDFNFRNNQHDFKNFHQLLIYVENIEFYSIVELENVMGVIYTNDYMYSNINKL